MLKHHQSPGPGGDISCDQNRVDAGDLEAQLAAIVVEHDRDHVLHVVTPVRGSPSYDKPKPYYETKTHDVQSSGPF